MNEHQSSLFITNVNMEIQKEITEKYLRCIFAAEEELGSRLDRMREASLAFVDTSSPSGQKPNFLLFHNLFHSPFWEMRDFPIELKQIFADFEGLNDRLLNEFIGEIDSLSLRKGLTAYHGYKSDWLRYDLVKGGGRIEASVPNRFPTLNRLFLKIKEKHYLSGAYLAKMLPGTHLSTHSGAFNSVIRMHYGIKIPKGDLGINVHGKTCKWGEGKWLIFDDTYPHEAWNNSEEERWIMLLRILHPDLSETERKAFNILERNPLFWSVHKEMQDSFLKKFLVNQ